MLGDHIGDLLGPIFYFCQVLEAEKCLRIKSLISYDNLKELQETFSDISELKTSEVFENTGILIEFWHENKMEFSTQSSNDESIKYYCAGYVAISLAKNQKCEHCRQLI